MTDSSELCARCLEFDIDQLFDLDESAYNAGESTFKVSLGLIEDLETSGCKLCRLFGEMAPRDLTPIARESETSDWLMKRLPMTLRLLRLSKSFNVLAVVPEPRERHESFQYAMQRLIDSKGYLAQEPKHTAPGVLRRVKTIRQNFSLAVAEYWLSHCSQNHGPCAAREGPKPSRLRMIDCRTRELVSAPENCRYAALSYVWGKQHGAPRSKGKLEKVIEDAITVAQHLNLDYLWVDRYCIFQHDGGNDREHQISQMDLIYANSALTIVAAAGDGPDHGLPGINDNPRLPQPQITIRNHTLISTLPDPQWTVGQSTWSSRGWTYQEGLLSRKLLIFTERQVFFQCNTSHQKETIPWTRRKSSLLTYAGHSVAQPGLDTRDYLDYVAVYSQRELSYSDDYMHAFRGILTALRREKWPLYTFYGIPLPVAPNDPPHPVTDTDREPRSRSSKFAVSLLWAFNGFSHRLGLPRFKRTSNRLPSWSWLAWTGQIPSPANVSDIQEYHPHWDDIRVWFERANGLRQSVDDLDFTHIANMEAEYTPRIRIEAWSIDVTITARHIGCQGTKKEELILGLDPRRDYVCLPARPQGAVYTELRSNDHTRSLSVDDAYLAILPSHCNTERLEGLGLLIRKSDNTDYERVGLFYLEFCITIGDDGKFGWVKTRKMEKGVKRTLDSQRRQIWLK